jgi:hypothetical protein
MLIIIVKGILKENGLFYNETKMNIYDYRDTMVALLNEFVEYWTTMEEDQPSNFPREMPEPEWDEQFLAYASKAEDFL